MTPSSEPGKRLAERTGAEVDRSGRVIVGGDLAIPGRPEIFVIGDLAHAKGATGEALPSVAPVAIQQGRYVARAVRARVSGNAPLMVTIGNARAVRLFDNGRQINLERYTTAEVAHITLK